MGEGPPPSRKSDEVVHDRREEKRVQAVGLGHRDGWVFTDGDGKPIHPHALSQTSERIARRAGVPAIGLHDVRHTHGSLLIKEGIPVKVVSERLGHANIAFTIQTYQHVLPGMQADAARTFELLATPIPPARADPVERGGTAGRTRPAPGRTRPNDEGPGP